jgi:hypothetical protein
MLLTISLALLFLSGPKEKPRPHIPAGQLAAIAKQIATEEGWPIAEKGYTFDPMTPTEDDGFDSIGLYQNAHLVRMYSVDRTTGDIVDFMRGCDVFQFHDLDAFKSEIKKRSHSPTLTTQELAIKAGCPHLTVVNSRWVR